MIVFLSVYIIGGHWGADAWGTCVVVTTGVHQTEEVTAESGTNVGFDFQTHTMHPSQPQYLNPMDHSIDVRYCVTYIYAVHYNVCGATHSLNCRSTPLHYNVILIKIHAWIVSAILMCLSS